MKMIPGRPPLPRTWPLKLSSQFPQNEALSLSLILHADGFRATPRIWEAFIREGDREEHARVYERGHATEEIRKNTFRRGKGGGGGRESLMSQYV